MNAAARKAFKVVTGVTDQTKYNPADPRFLQAGEIHGKQVYENKSGDLPATTSHREYDTAKYKGDPRLRGSERVVIGADGTHWYTDNHYVDFAPFTPGSAAPTATTATPTSVTAPP